MLGQIAVDYPSQVRLVYKDFPLPSHPGARPAAEAARCAGAVGSFWDYHDLLFVAFPHFSREDLIGYAGRLGLDRTAFTTCLDEGRFRNAVEADIGEGRSLGVTGTPTFFINGRRIVGAHPIETFREAIQDALDAARKK